MSVSRETEEKLAEYAVLIRKWNPKINLVAPASLPDLEERHIKDSLQIATLAGEAHGSWLDIGSGGGLPGLVVAITRPNLSVSLIESDGRKTAFLRTVARELKLTNVTIIADRIEKHDRLDAANISARALAPLPLLMSYVERHLAAEGTAWLMKGRNWKQELSQARQEWEFDVIAHPSVTDHEAAILQISGIRHV